MEKNITEIPFNFSYFALKLLGKNLYSNKWSAISELVANGLDAGATEVRVFIDSIDKEHSTIEIFDNGTGMSQSDLTDKYALLGRNKRETEVGILPTTKGRKGIGKLAGLFLSQKYYLSTKKDGIESTWVLDSINATNSDIPKLIRVSPEEVRTENMDIWGSYSHGTLIKLTDVDMRGFADAKLESLKNSLANYYLLNNLGATLEVAYRTKENQPISYSKVSKNVAFQNFFSFFQTSENFIDESLLSSYINVKAKYDSVSKKPRSVIKRYPEDFEKLQISGEKIFVDAQGNDIKLPYELKGWLGIHSSINMSEVDSEKGDGKRFIKNSIYKANQLRLYVRDKLAVANFIDYLDNSQAFRVYIEGEISFDILDDDRLEDISTSNREGFKIEDERVQLLISLLRPIVNKLVQDRVAVGAEVRREVSEIEEAKRLELEKEKEKAEQQRLNEKRQKELAEQKQRESELAQKAAEQARIEAEQKRIQAEIEQEVEKLKRLKTEQELKITSKQALFLRQLTNPRFENATEALHAMYTESDSILVSINSISQKLYEHQEKYIISEISEDIYGIAIPAQKIKKLYDMAFSADFNLSEQIQVFVLQDFIEQYIGNILRPTKERFSKIEFEFYNNDSLKTLVKFNTTELGVVIDNLVNNSYKAGAKKITLNFLNKGQYTVLEFKDDGCGLSTSIMNPEKIFELGYTTTDGTGVGLSHVRRVMTENGGYINLDKDNQNGFKLDLGFINEH
ncbi:TPA: sensor histidine kinase [Streptococcus suis]|nr:sensor histidine kinase [Streptococcus suis]HEM3666840.1 sensor histidine kinase [Streptococcus suis]HEM3720816.1 sensor histidine kinase [Streptococcus suis]